jgi:hypothetical protein
MMPWAYLDDGFPEHPKVIAAGGDAAWLFVAALCWSRRHLSAGDIPKSMIGRLTDRRMSTKLARRLVDVGLWADKGDHYAIHDYDAWNGSEEAARERRKERATLAARARWKGASGNAQADPEHVPEQSTSNAEGNALSNAGGDAGAMPYASGRASGPSLSPPSNHLGGNSSNALPDPANPDEEQERNGAPRPHPDRRVLDHIAATIGWTTPLKRAQLVTEWDFGATLLDRRVLEDVLLRCGDARSARYLRNAIRTAAAAAGVEVPAPP